MRKAYQVLMHFLVLSFARYGYWFPFYLIAPHQEPLLKNMDMEDKAKFLTAAFEEAKQGYAQGGIPIGSVLVYRGEIIGRGHNKRVQEGSVILHGEMDALENAGRRPASVYRECVMYTTLSPCSMCSGTILLYGIPKVVIGENKTFRGEEELLKSRGVVVEVLDDAACYELMQKFIQENPALWNEDIGV
jgi:cytosine/creatinine deaminase